MRRTAWCLALAFLVLYGARLCPTLCLTGDSAELVTAAAVWGVPHAPGYPLFTAFAHVFASVPVGEVAWRVHATSALFHACTLAATAAVVFEITADAVASLAAASALGLARTFFVGSLYAEVFPLNDLFFGALLLLALRVRAGRASLVGFAVLAGLASAHHMMIALAAPALAMLVGNALWRERRRAPALGAAFLVPFAVSYALVPIAAARDPALSWGDVHDAASFVALVTRRDYGGLFSAVHGGGHGTGPERLAALGQVFAASFGIVTLAAALAGAVALVRKDRTVGAALLVALALAGPVFAWDNALDTGSEATLAYFARFTTMAHLPVAVLAGAGAAALREGLGPRRRFAALALLGAWTALAALRARDVTLGDDRRGIAYAHDLVFGAPDGALLLLTGDAPANAALYVCAVERRCGDRVALSPGGLFLPWAMEQIRRRHPEIAIPWTSGPALKHTHELALAAIGARPVFVYPDLLAKDPGLGDAFDAVPDHLLFRLWPKGTDAAREAEVFAQSARAMTTGEGCEGCRRGHAPRLHPSQGVQIDQAYEAARVNHAQAAARFQ